MFLLLHEVSMCAGERSIIPSDCDRRGKEIKVRRYVLRAKIYGKKDPADYKMTVAEFAEKTYSDPQRVRIEIEGGHYPFAWCDRKPGARYAKYTILRRGAEKYIADYYGENTKAHKAEQERAALDRIEKSL